jgi:NAD(P)-dependent dehydrogenase (short-subunit alcohol dehydrogenase family)
VLVTGCSSGFGEAIALAFAARGDAVVASMRRCDDASAALRSARGISCVALDVTDAVQRRDVVAGITARHGRLDILISNAGQVLFGSVEDTPDDAARQLFEVNYFGAVGLMRQVIPIMRAQGGGRIVAVTAIGAILATPLLGTYGATKHALDAICAVADLKARRFGVRVSTVLPGQFKTAPSEKSLSSDVSKEYDEIRQALGRYRAERSADVLEDLSPVVAATIEAATATNPLPRYMVGVGLVAQLTSAVHALEALHEHEAMRAGLADSANAGAAYRLSQ